MSRLAPTLPTRRPACLRASRLAALAAVVVGLSGCAAMTAQNPSGALRPVNAVADGGDERVMLKGADVVAYFTQNRHVPGTPQFRSTYEGVTFRFASAEHKALFDAAPRRYLPQYGGYCANGLVYAIPWGGDADTWRMIDGKLYIFGGQGSRDAFELDVPANLKLADAYWRDEVAGTHSFWQRTKRLVFKVPHYKSGEALAKAVAEAKAKPR
ncbi:MAG TPA: YHS domain-containing (seleno)protein [Burkholderiaceae bacterium]|nr:YHS domain-containing (seleno)protein [Burkholderiaceae bacterium]